MYIINTPAPRPKLFSSSQNGIINIPPKNNFNSLRVTWIKCEQLLTNVYYTI